MPTLEDPVYATRICVVEAVHTPKNSKKKEAIII
jgi:hypothetical protein